MKTFTALVAVALSLSGALAQGPPMVNTPPSATVCQPLLITWTGGTPPFFLSVLPGNQPSAPAIVDFGEVGDVTSHRWAAVNVPAGSQIGLNLRDSTGTLSQSAPFPVNPGSDTSCLNATTSTTSSTSTSSSSTTTTTTRNTTSTSTTTTTSTTTPPTTTTTSTSPTTTQTTPPPDNTEEPAGDNAALSRFGQISVAGAVAAAVAAMLL